MAKLYVDKKIRINAPAQKVWEALTSRACTDIWSLEFGSDGPLMHVESDWQLGSPVLWKDEEGTLLVQGIVTAVTPRKMMRYTVFDTRTERPETSPEDGITYELTEQEGNIAEDKNACRSGIAVTSFMRNTFEVRDTTTARFIR
ncbi:MAG: Activator of Hsp90 ATPase 1 family protein [Parcubacteria group bacterium GW2011_GWA1_56_13]|nr:MAG: Activator of Hsp90 ATPase 1 family protein [Parcubacteria group bacterium GW2011_GWA1_56_13]